MNAPTLIVLAVVALLAVVAVMFLMHRRKAAPDRCEVCSLKTICRK